MAKVGRPTDYDPKFCDMLLEHMRNLHSFESFAAEANVCRATLYDWCKAHPEFLDARKKGRDIAQKGLENVGKGLMTGKIKGNVAAWIFYMKNMTNWRDDPNTEIDAIEDLNFYD
jgi:hypothetical protein